MKCSSQITMKKYVLQKVSLFCFCLYLVFWSGVFWLYQNYYKEFYIMNPYSKSIFAKKGIQKEKQTIFIFITLLILRSLINEYENLTQQIYYLITYILFQILQIQYKKALPYFNKKLLLLNFFYITLYKNICLNLFLLGLINTQLNKIQFQFVCLTFLFLSILELFQFNKSQKDIQKSVIKKYGDYTEKENYILKLIYLCKNQKQQKHKGNLVYFLKVHVQTCLVPDCNCHEIMEFLEQIILNNLDINQEKQLYNFVRKEILKLTEASESNQYFQFYYLYFCKEQLQNNWIMYYLKNIKADLFQKNFMVQLSLFYYSIEKEFQKVEKQKNQKMNCLQFCNYSQEISYFQQQIQMYFQILIILLNYMKQSSLVLSVVQNTLYSLYRLNKQIKTQFKKLDHLKSQQIHQIFGSYLLLTKENKQNAHYYIQLGNKNMFNYKDEFFKTIFDKSRFNDKGIFIVSGNKENLGQIISFNKDMENILQINSDKLQKRNINVVIPKIIAEIHDQLITNLFESGKSTSMKKLLENFSLDSKKFMIPMYSVIQTLPWIYENGINFISLIIEDNILKNKSLVIYHPKDFRILGVNKKCFEQFGINPSFTYDVNDQLCRKAFFNLFPELKDFTTINQLKDNGRINSKFDYGYIVRECLQNPYNTFVKEKANKQYLLNLQEQFKKESLMRNVQLVLIRQSSYQLGLQMNVLELRHIQNKENNEALLQTKTPNKEQIQEYVSLVSFQSDSGEKKGSNTKNIKKKFQKFIFSQFLIILLLLLLISQSIVFGILTFKKLKEIRQNSKNKLTGVNILQKQQEISLQISSSLFFIQFFSMQYNKFPNHQNIQKQAINYFFDIEFQDFYTKFKEKNNENMQQLYIDNNYTQIVSNEKNNFIQIDQNNNSQEQEEAFVNYYKTYFSVLLNLQIQDFVQFFQNLQNRSLYTTLSSVLDNTRIPLYNSFMSMINQLWSLYEDLENKKYQNIKYQQLFSICAVIFVFFLLKLLQIIFLKKQASIFKFVIFNNKNKIDKKIENILKFLESQKLSQDLQNNIIYNQKLENLKHTLKNLSKNELNKTETRQQLNLKQLQTADQKIQLKIPSLSKIQQNKNNEQQTTSSNQIQKQLKFDKQSKKKITKFVIITFSLSCILIYTLLTYNNFIQTFFEKQKTYIKFLKFKNELIKVEIDLQAFIDNKIKNKPTGKDLVLNPDIDLFKKIKKQNSITQSFLFQSFHNDLNQIFTIQECQQNIHSFSFDQTDCQEVFQHGLDFMLQYYYQSITTIYNQIEINQEKFKDELINNKRFWNINTIQRQVTYVVDKLDMYYVQYLKKYLKNISIFLIILYVVQVLVIIVIIILNLKFLYDFIFIKRKCVQMLNEIINS